MAANHRSARPYDVWRLSDEPRRSRCSALLESSESAACSANGIGVRRGTTSGEQAAPVTLGYPESGHQLRELRYLVLHAGLTGSPEKPHNSATRQRIPQDPHGLNGTLRCTCYACERHGEQSASSVDARELGCRGLSQVSALGMTGLLKAEGRQFDSAPDHDARRRHARHRRPGVLAGRRPRSSGSVRRASARAGPRLCDSDHNEAMASAARQELARRRYGLTEVPISTC